MGRCPAERINKPEAVSLNVDETALLNDAKLESTKKNLEDLVLYFEVIVLIWITLRKLVDVDPKLINLLSDLEYMDTVNWNRQKYKYNSSSMCVFSDFIPSASFCGPLLVSGSQLWPQQEQCSLCDAKPSYTPHPEAEDWCYKEKHNYVIAHKQDQAKKVSNYFSVRLLQSCSTSLASWADVEHGGGGVPVAKWRDKVEAAVDSVVLDVASVQPALISEVLFKLLVDVVFYWIPADTDTQHLWVKQQL